MVSMNVEGPSAPSVSQRKSGIALLSPAEWRLIFFIVAICFSGFVTTIVRNQAVDWLDFVPVIGTSLVLVFVGAFLRKARDMPRTAMGAIGFGLFMCFSASAGIFTFGVLPFVNPMIDQQLLAADAAMGFSWVNFVTAVADYPTIGIALRYVYLSILPQFAFVIVFLSYLNRETDLHRFLTVGFLGLLTSVCVWWLFPSVGPAAYGMVSPEVQQKILLVANADYGTNMALYSTQGVDIITGSKMTGVVAFPSFHIVMTCMVLWFTRQTWMFIPLLVLNATMPIATVLHGGHHVVDLFGGFCVFVFCLWLGTRFVPEAPISGNVT